MKGKIVRSWRQILIGNLSLSKILSLSGKPYQRKNAHSKRCKPTCKELKRQTNRNKSLKSYSKKSAILRTR